MAVWLEDFADARVLAVTGTKGKSTTAALPRRSSAGTDRRGPDREHRSAGHRHLPAATLADAYVVEVSSYQAADVTVTPAVCVLTSLAPDHLDWHRGLEQATTATSSA